MGCKRRHGDAGFDSERYGEGEQRTQAPQFVGVGQVRGLQREALDLEIAEHGFDGPALTIAGKRVTRPAGSGQGQQLA
jgi:hypothetical protein